MIRSKTLYVALSWAALVLAPLNPAAAQRGGGGGQQRDIPPPRVNPQFLATFRSATADASRSTVRILCDDKEAALGTIVGPDGWILTKHSLCTGKVCCKLKDGATLEAKIVGIHEAFDLAMLKIEASGLHAVTFTESKVAPVGNWIVSVGTDTDPVAVGVMSVATRTPPVVANRGGPPRPPSNAPARDFLGINVVAEADLAKIVRVAPQSAASKAGLKLDDKILSIQGSTVTDQDSLLAVLEKHKLGDALTIKLLREGKELELKATLENPAANDYLGLMVSPDQDAAKVTRVAFQGAAARAGVRVDDRLLSIQGMAIKDQDALLAVLGKMKPGDSVTLKLMREGKELELKAILDQQRRGQRRDQNLMGSELSAKRTGFPTYFQTDTVIKPTDCGGPVCDLDGHVIGINIARAGRVESYAVPTEALTPLMADLMSGKLSPKLVAVAALEKKIAELKSAVQKAEEARTAADKKLQEAQDAVKKQEADKALTEKSLKESKDALDKAEKELKEKK